MMIWVLYEWDLRTTLLSVCLEQFQVRVIISESSLGRIDSYFVSFIVLLLCPLRQIVLYSQKPIQQSL